MIIRKMQVMASRYNGNACTIRLRRRYAHRRPQSAPVLIVFIGFRFWLCGQLIHTVNGRPACNIRG